MKPDALFIVDDLKQVEDRARKLILHTLAHVQSEIDIMAVKIDLDNPQSLSAIGYRVVILVKTTGGDSLRSEARDCDEILAVHMALDKLVHQIPSKAVGVNSCRIDSLGIVDRSTT